MSSKCLTKAITLSVIPKLRYHLAIVNLNKQQLNSLSQIVCRVHGHDSADDEDAYTRKPLQYSDLNSEDTFLDPTHQDYYQETTQPSVKVERDDSTFTAGLTVNPNIIAKGPQTFSRPSSGTPFASATSNFGGHPNGLNLGGLDHGGGSFGSFGLHTGGVNNGGGYSFSGGN